MSSRCIVLGDAPVNVWVSTSPRIGYVVLAATTIVAFAADRLSKVVLVPAIIPVEGDSVSVVGSLLHLTHVHNTGVAFGMFTNRNAFFGLVSLMVLGVIVNFYRYLPADVAWLKVSLGLILGGAAGNLLDRARQGFVTDFIQVPHWPVFNVADSCICVGVAMLAAFLLLRGDGEREREGVAHGPARVGEHSSLPDR